MKKKLRFLLSAFLAIAFFSCKEVGPNINLTGDNGNNGGGGGVDSTQQKTVLIEDFTATNCPNCPKARAILDNLQSANPGRIEVVEVHQGVLSVPLLPGDPALKTDDGESLANLLGPPQFWPTGAIDRKAYEVAPADFERLVDRGLWSTYVPQELDSVLKVKLGLNMHYDDALRQLTGSVTADFFQTIIDPLNITVLITENGIVAAQVDGLILDSNYVHRDVLRKIITSNFAGDPVTGAKTAGSEWTYNLTQCNLPDEWNADSCRIIAFISRSAGSYDVLQAIGQPLK